MKLHRFVQLLPMFLLPFFATGCSDDPPNAIGINGHPKNDGLSIVTYDTTAISTSTYLSRISGATTQLMLGKYRDNIAYSLVSFTIDSTKYRKTRLDTASLKFSLVYKFKDSVGTIGFEIHNMRSSWTPGTYKWDSLTTGSYSDTIIGKYTFSIHPTDSVLSVRLDTNAVRAWIGNGVSSLILIPDSQSTIILGLASVNYNQSLQPKLSIAYHDSVDSAFVDSIFTTQKVFIANNSFTVPAQHCFIQGAIAERTILKFDVSGIPKNTSITEATLQLSVDTLLSIRGNSFNNAVMAHIALDDSAKPTIGGLAGSWSMVTPTTVTFPVATVVQHWVTTRVNYGMVVKIDNEYINFDRFAFYDQNASPGLRPKLMIKYSVVK